MLAFLPSPLLFVINFIMLSIVTLLVAIPMLFCALFKWIPLKAVGSIINAVNQTAFRFWIANNAFLMWLTNKTEWDIQGIAELDKVKGSCIIISNHISWTDIVMLAHIYRGKIPITKFFLKHSLIYIPVIGLVCYAIGMPFLRRYTREQLLKNPKLKTKDIDSTRKACLSLLEHPSSLINFVEGTRHTEEKAQIHDSQYTNLMPPKAASLAVALGIIGNNIECLLNTTLLYPHTEGNIFFALLCGRLKKVVARVEKIEPKEEWVGDYLKDKQFKRKFTANLRDLWRKKDEQLTQIKIAEGLLPASAAATAAAADATEPAPTESAPTESAPIEHGASEQAAAAGETSEPSKDNETTQDSADVADSDLNLEQVSTPDSSTVPATPVAPADSAATAVQDAATEVKETKEVKEAKQD